MIVDVEGDSYNVEMGKVFFVEFIHYMYYLVEIVQSNYIVFNFFT